MPGAVLVVRPVTPSGTVDRVAETERSEPKWADTFCYLCHALDVPHSGVYVLHTFLTRIAAIHGK